MHSQVMLNMIYAKKANLWFALFFSRINGPAKILNSYFKNCFFDCLRFIACLNCGPVSIIWITDQKITVC